MTLRDVVLFLIGLHTGLGGILIASWRWRRRQPSGYRPILPGPSSPPASAYRPPPAEG